MLAEDQVLEQMLERLRDALPAGGLDRGLECLDRLLLGRDEPGDDLARILAPLELSDVDRGRSAEGRDLPWYSKPNIAPDASVYPRADRC